MENVSGYVEVKSYGNVYPKKGTNVRTPYEHQKKAMDALDKINQEQSFSTLVVLPTGERVIIVTGCINVLVSRVSGTLTKYNSCIA